MLFRSVDGKSVQKALLAEGLAKVAVYPPNVKYVDEYRAIEAVAKEQKKGIWADDPCADTDNGKDDGSNNDGAKPDDDQKDDGNKGTDDNKQDNMIEQPKSGGGNGQNGGKLPKTATSYPTMALLGAGIMAVGLGLLLIRRRAA